MNPVGRDARAEPHVEFPTGRSFIAACSRKHLARLRSGQAGKYSDHIDGNGVSSGIALFPLENGALNLQHNANPLPLYLVEAGRLH
jgi:hypothetical protein